MDEDPKVQLNVLVRSKVKRAAQETITRYKNLAGQPQSLSELVDKCLEWYVEAEK